MKAINSTRIPELLDALANKSTVFAPMQYGKDVYFRPWHPGAKVQWQQNSLLSPKDLLFPQTEMIYQYARQADTYEIIPDEPAAAPQLIFGLRNCDLHSIRLLDKVFLSGSYPDPAYEARRKNTTLIVLNCHQPQLHCFCTSLGVDPQGGAGADLVLFALTAEPAAVTDAPGIELGVEAKSERGQAILEKYPAFFTDTMQQPLPFSGCKTDFQMEDLSAKLPGIFVHPIWSDISRRCLACGVCTHLCPTCHCFDLQGEQAGEQGHRYRCWDSCMFSDYTLMAGGHDPRPTKLERFRNRFLHKLAYFPERYGEYLCSGCGRCLAKCPVNIDISYVVKKLKEAAADVR
jgi:ferredoxin